MQVFLNKVVQEYEHWIPHKGTTAFALKAGKQWLLKGIGIDPGDSLIFERAQFAKDGEICVVREGDDAYRLVRHYNTVEAYLLADHDSPFEPFAGGQVLWRYVWFLKHR